MEKTGVAWEPNPDLTIVTDNKPRWNTPDHRRAGFHNLHRNARYAISLRADKVLTLEKCLDRRIADMAEVRRLTGSNIFSGMVVVRGRHVLHEAYAPDFGPDRPHSIMSITKTHMNFVIGQLAEAGTLDLGKTVAHYLPEIGSGYAEATLQQVLNMDVANDYTEDYGDPFTGSYLHELPMGWRLPGEGQDEETHQDFLAAITSEDVTNRSGAAVYKSANTDVLAWVAERASGRPMRHFLAEIVEAAGLEHALYITTDREGGPWMSGGGCLTARDLARYGSLFVRRGAGVDGRRVGSADFIERTRNEPGPRMPAPRDALHYSNQTNTNGRWLGHGGYGGQYMLADLDSGVVGVFFSVLENREAHDPDYSTGVISMLETIAELPPDGD
jgi:CubicO group peptidase (beta-lactamase class C family)